MSDPSPARTDWAEKVQNLLQPISAERRTGGDGRIPYDYTRTPPAEDSTLGTIDDIEAECVTLKAMVRRRNTAGEEVTEEAVVKAPDWRVLRNRSEQILRRSSKHLRAGVVWTVGATATEHWKGLAKGLWCIAGLLDKYWDNLHPELDGSDPWERANLLGELALEVNKDGDPYNFVRLVSCLPLIHSTRHSPEASGPSSSPPPAGCIKPGCHSLAEIQAVRDPSASILPAQTPLPSAADLSAAWNHTPPNEVAEVADAVRGSLDALRHIEGTFANRAPHKPGPVLARLRSVLEEARQTIDAASGGGEAVVAVAAAAATPDGQSLSASPSQPGSPWTSRDDVLRAIARVREFLRRTDPASPVGPLVMFALALSRSGCDRAMGRLPPEAVATLRAVFGDAGMLWAEGERSEEAGAASPPTPPDKAADGTATVIPGEAAGLCQQREESLAVLRRAEAFLRATEPGSPVPVLLRFALRASRLSYLGMVEAANQAGAEHWARLQVLLEVEEPSGSARGQPPAP